MHYCSIATKRLIFQVTVGLNIDMILFNRCWFFLWPLLLAAVEDAFVYQRLHADQGN